MLKVVLSAKKAAVIRICRATLLAVPGSYPTGDSCMVLGETSWSTRLSLSKPANELQPSHIKTKLRSTTHASVCSVHITTAVPVTKRFNATPHPTARHTAHPQLETRDDALFFRCFFLPPAPAHARTRGRGVRQQGLEPEAAAEHGADSASPARAILRVQAPRDGGVDLASGAAAGRRCGGGEENIPTGGLRLTLSPLPLSVKTCFLTFSSPASVEAPNGFVFS